MLEMKAKVIMLFPDQTKLAQEKGMVGLASLLHGGQWVLFWKTSFLAIAEFQNCVWQIHGSLFAAAPAHLFLFSGVRSGATHPQSSIFRWQS